MRLVNIYIGTDSQSTRKSKKSYGYVLECFIRGEPQTKEGFGELEGTFNRVVLAAVNEAIGRMKEPCEIHLYTENTYILNMIDTHLEKWKKNGFMTSKEKPVKNQDKWQQYAEVSKDHLMVTESRENTYLNWIKKELQRKKEKENADVTV